MNIQQIIQNFEHKNFDEAPLDFFNHLGVPLNRLIEESIDVNDLLGVHKDFSIIDTTYMVGGIDDNIFQGHQSDSDLKIKRYEGLLVFAINLNISTPTRTQLSAISRIFNRKFEYTPVVILFKYANKLSLSNTQRQEYKQHWKEGEKVGKVSILRDIDIVNPHRGHLDILQNMKITSKVTDYETLYIYWQEVFDVSLLNKKFYQELSNWYSYAISEVVFPNQPKDTDNVEEHKSQNVIRLLTRFLFVWFIKEKGLIPNEIFDEEYIKKTVKDFNPKNMDGSLFGGHDKSSLYYKAILQNLFFASLNCPIKPLDSNDTRERGFRKKEHYGQNRDANFLMRYEDSFHNPQEFLELINQYVPFLNGGLFECLDDKTNGVYIDGFSDNLVKSHQLIVPDYLFFGVEEHVDLSTWYGSENKSFKDATVKGLIKILDSYKFTVTENTPLEEDVALDPELLGRVFENLLASYNPETKTTARKQTGSFYTPREIVSYMVDESLIAYLKTKLDDKDNIEKLEENLRELCSYSDKQPFENEKIIIKLINALDNLKALDPAVGSGAFPMGMLQKMVHILSKLDPDNKHWQELQLDKAKKESDDVFETKNKEEREKLLIEINNAFDETINNPDYARKLYIIENSIYGIDIQSIAIQISKLRFFISLVIEQKIDRIKPNFGVRPLPNLETKFIAANTLIGIDKQEKSLIDFDETIKNLEKELKSIRHRLFNAKTPRTKRKLRAKDKELREKISEELIKSGWNKDTAEKLAHWDPYEQNTSSPFFDMEWMFGIKDGFDIVIGNPPYQDYRKLDVTTKNKLTNFFAYNYSGTNKPNLYIYFIEHSWKFLNSSGSLYFINPNQMLIQDSSFGIRKFLFENTTIKFVKDLSYIKVFKEASTYPIVWSYSKKINIQDNIIIGKISNYADIWNQDYNLDINKILQDTMLKIITSEYGKLITKIEDSTKQLRKICNKAIVGTSKGGFGKLKITSEEFQSLTAVAQEEYSKLLESSDIFKYKIKYRGFYMPNSLYPANTLNIFSKEKIVVARMTNNIRAYLDINGFSVGKVNVLQGFTLKIKFVLAILNSKLIDFWYRNVFDALHLQGGGLGYELPYFLDIPIVLKTDNENIIELFVDMIIYSMNNHISENITNIIENILDSFIFELYFEEHMKENNINVIKFIEQNIHEVSPSFDFESLNDEKKEQIIQNLYEKWTHPDNEVRNRIKLFAVRSPDILKPILES